MKVAIYTRVSTLEQKEKGHSIEEQERKLRAYSDINDWKIHKVYTDAGYSGAKKDRPALQEMLNEIDNFDLILVYKLDRLTRSVKDLLEILELFENKNVSFRSATEVYDTTSAMGRLFVTLVGAMAEWERTTIQERTAMGRRASARKGLAKTVPPFYYDRVNDKFVPNEYKKVLRFAVEEAKKGTSLREITMKLNNSKYKAPLGKNWHRSVIRNALISPVARGHLVFGDIFVENTHEAIISEEEYKEIKQRISEKTNSTIVKHNAIFRSKLLCPNCNQKLTLNTVKHTPKNKEVWYSKLYFCVNCKNTKNKNACNIDEGEVLKQFYNYLKQFDLTSYKIKNQPKETEDVGIDIEKLRKERARCQTLFIEGMMNKDEAFPIISRIDQEIRDYENRKSDDKSKSFDYEKIKNFKYSLLNGWELMEDELKTEFIKMAIKNIHFEYVRGIKGKRQNSLRITGIEFY
ncbi:TPA: recombinase family protein [Staphylococcus aureus]|nr:recombinase family protein [Staphylococcus aureus]HDJ1599916.1 recombinase family protein [Staphylococcus aureus]HDJ2665248.1 recombinase family protein [Staphylococcus aureus]HEI4301809.1 recombinase family protein [Staphylococcus aureus]